MAKGTLNLTAGDGIDLQEGTADLAGKLIISATGLPPADISDVIGVCNASTHAGPTNAPYFITAILGGGGGQGGGTSVYGMFFKYSITKHNAAHTCTVTYKPIGNIYSTYTVTGTGVYDNSDKITISSWEVKDSTPQ